MYVLDEHGATHAATVCISPQETHTQKWRSISL